MSASREHFADHRLNLSRLVWLRILIQIVVFIAIWLTNNYLALKLPLGPLAIVVTVALFSCLITIIRLRSERPVRDFELFSQFLFDVLLLTLFLFFTGGSTNPFATLYLIPLTLTAATLPGVYTWLMVILTSTCYTFLLFFYIPLFDMHASHQDGFQLHIIGMWMGFILSAGLIASFAVQMTATVQRQKNKIAQLREQQLRQEQVLALGTLAAGAAHELGTPLSTLAILLNDIESNQPLPKTIQETMIDQVKRCKHILASITAASGHIKAESGRLVCLQSYLEELINNWKLSRTDVHVDVQMNIQSPSPEIVADQTLSQALINVFNNAADASPEKVDISVSGNHDTVTIEVIDYGGGMTQETLGKAGGTIHTTKKDGLGLGLFLTYATLERLGGEVRLFNHHSGGVNCKITIPLSTLHIHQQTHDGHR